MTIQEAMKSGKPFKRKDDEDVRWIVKRGHKLFITHKPSDENQYSYRPTTFKMVDILADDWEIKED